MADKLDRIIGEEITRLVEGLNLDTSSMSVGVDSSHQDYVDTNDLSNPHPFYSTYHGYKVISVLRNKWDHNPLIWALKGKKWHFNDTHRDVMFLLRRLVAVTRELHESFDTIITTPSSSKLNNQLLSMIERLIPHKASYKNFFRKYTAMEVYRNLAPEDRIMLRKYFMKMENLNDGIFSYKYIPAEYRDRIGMTMSVNDLALADEINGKNVLILDDTVTTGKTISDSAKALLSTFTPGNITFFTIMTPEE